MAQTDTVFLKQIVTQPLWYPWKNVTPFPCMCGHVLEMHSHRVKNAIFGVHPEWGGGSSAKIKNQRVPQDRHSSWALDVKSLRVWILHQEAEAVPTASRLNSDFQRTRIGIQREDWGRQASCEILKQEKFQDATSDDEEPCSRSNQKDTSYVKVLGSGDS